MSERETSKEGKEEVKELDVKQIVSFLNHAFREATQGMGKAIRSENGDKTVLYDLQVDFSYMLDNIQRGPKYIVPKVVTDCNAFIAKIAELKASIAQQKAEAQA